MTYYVGNMPVGDHLMHYGTKGMKWGRRRYQNPDGSLTAAGRVRYGVSNAYSRARDSIRRAGGFRKATKDGRRLGKQAMRGWYKKNKKTIKKVGIAVGAGAAAAGATYLGMRYGKGAAKTVARTAGKLHTRAGMMRGMTGGALRKAGRGVGSKLKRSRVVNGVRMAGYEALGRADNAFHSGKKTAKHLGNKMYLAGNNVRTRAGMARGMAGGTLKKARRSASSAGSKLKRSRVVNGVRMAGYEALGRADNAIQRAKRGGIQFDAKYAASRAKGAARKAGGAVKGAANKAKRSKAVTKARMAGYEVLGRADNAAQKARGTAKRVGKTVRTKTYSAGARAALKNGIYRSTHSSQQIARRAGIKAGAAVGSGTAAYIVRRKKKKSRR